MYRFWLSKAVSREGVQPFWTLSHSANVVMKSLLTVEAGLLGRGTLMRAGIVCWP